ncbi:hypothetical protein QW131_33370 [Roseibium salinum]|nr:hypothetical protein [Roseibium salinum]
MPGVEIQQRHEFELLEHQVRKHIPQAVVHNFGTDADECRCSRQVCPGVGQYGCAVYVTPWGDKDGSPCIGDLLAPDSDFRRSRAAEAEDQGTIRRAGRVRK